jgi:carbamoyltransferase
VIVLGLIGRPDVPDCHDAAACLVEDGRIVHALEQERVSRCKRAPGAGPAEAAQRCLRQAGRALREVDAIAYGWLEDLERPGPGPEPGIVVSSDLTSLLLPREVFAYEDPPDIFFVKHHLAHAASSFWTSGFPEAAGLVIDGQGERESISIYHATANGIRCLRTFPLECSLGLFYEAAAFYAGLGWDAAGKLMGLASYGDADCAVDPGILFDEEQCAFALPPEVSVAVDGGASAISRAWIKHFERIAFPYTVGDAGTVMSYQHFAAAVQRRLECIACGLAAYARRETGCDRLIIGGGVALNCAMNQALAVESPGGVFAFPSAHDAGAAVGAALTVARHLAPADVSPAMTAADLGCEIADHTIAPELRAIGLRPERLSRSALIEQACSDLVSGHIVAWFQGRDEFGPRALGHRSLLAHPGRRTSTDRLNAIKGRERWRPIAPSVQREHAATIFETPIEPNLGRFMLTVGTIRASYRSRIPAVTHVDATARPHLVDRATNPLFWDLIEAFRRRTGLPLVCNTSLNRECEPIVHSVRDVAALLTAADVDAAAIGPYYVRCYSYARS